MIYKSIYGGIVLKKNIFIGCGTALVTPFTKDGVDFVTLKKLIDFQIQQGADALLILGTTGESSTMTLEEKIGQLFIKSKLLNLLLIMYISKFLLLLALVEITQNL